MSQPRVLLLTLSERTSGRGNRYMSGWLGRASVVAFPADEPDKWGNPVWNVYVSEPEPRAEAGQERDPARRPGAKTPPDREGVSDRRGRDGAPADRNGALRQRSDPIAADGAAKDAAPPAGRGDGWRGPSAYRRGNGAQRAPVAYGVPFYDDPLDDIGRGY